MSRIDEVLERTLDSFQAIRIDDGSRDDRAAILDERARRRIVLDMRDRTAGVDHRERVG